MAMKPKDLWMGVIGVFYIACFLGILGGVAYLLYGPGVHIAVPEFFGGEASTTSAEQAPAVPSALEAAEGILFVCQGGRALKAHFFQRAVQLALSDGRTITLPQVPSRENTRFANPDGSFVFLAGERSVSVKENGTETYRACAPQG